MKIKNFNKKLFLKKETVSHLGRKDMSKLQAGYGTETWVAVYGGGICPNGTTYLDSRCPIDTCTC